MGNKPPNIVPTFDELIPLAEERKKAGHTLHFFNDNFRRAFFWLDLDTNESFQASLTSVLDRQTVGPKTGIRIQSVSDRKALFCHNPKGVLEEELDEKLHQHFGIENVGIKAGYFLGIDADPEEELVYFSCGYLSHVF